MTSIFSSAQRGQIIFFSLFTVGQHGGQFFSPGFGFRQILHRLAVVAARSGATGVVASIMSLSVMPAGLEPGSSSRTDMFGNCTRSPAGLT
jgi:hypothetical protein